MYRYSYACHGGMGEDSYTSTLHLWKRSCLLDGKLDGPHGWSGHFQEKKITYPVLGIELYSFIIQPLA